MLIGAYVWFHGCRTQRDMLLWAVGPCFWAIVVVVVVVFCTGMAFSGLPICSKIDESHVRVAWCSWPEDNTLLPFLFPSELLHSVMIPVWLCPVDGTGWVHFS